MHVWRSVRWSVDAVASFKRPTCVHDPLALFLIYGDKNVVRLDCMTMKRKTGLYVEANETSPV